MKISWDEVVDSLRIGFVLFMFALVLGALALEVGTRHWPH